jgi:hypothetical protein
MAIQKSTLVSGIKRSNEQLEKGNIKGAVNTIKKLGEKVDAQKPSAPRKPSPYGLFVKSEFPKMKSEFPNLGAPEILKKIAVEWKKKKKS